MGFFGGIAQGIGPALLAKHREKVERELAIKQQEIEHYTKISQMDNLKPFEMGMILKSLGDLANTDPTTKKGKKGEQNILHQLGEVVSGAQSEGKPDVDKYEASGTRPRSIKDVPKKPGSAFYTSKELGEQELEEKGPLEKMKLDEILKRQDISEKQKEADREKLAAFNWKQRGDLQKRAQDAKAQGNLPGIASAIMAAGEMDGNPIDLKTAMGQAGKLYLQGLDDKHKNYLELNKNRESEIKTRVSNLNLALQKFEERKKEVAFNQHIATEKVQIQALNQSYHTALTSWVKERASLDALMGTKEKLIADANKVPNMTPEKAKEVQKQVDDLDKKIEASQKSVGNASDAIQKSIDEVNKITNYDKPSEDSDDTKVEDMTTDPISKTTSKKKLSAMPTKDSKTSNTPEKGHIVTYNGKKIRIKKVENGMITDYEEVK